MVILIFLKDLFDQKRLLKSAYLEVNNMKQVAHKYLRYTFSFTSKNSNSYSSNKGKGKTDRNNFRDRLVK